MVSKKKAYVRSFKMIYIRLANDVHRKLKMETVKQATTIQKWVAKLIEEKLS